MKAQISQRTQQTETMPVNTGPRKRPKALNPVASIVIGLTILAGCATPPARQAITFDAEAFNHHIPAIYVMPVIDARSDKSAKLDDADYQRMKEIARQIIAGLGYQAISVNAWGTEADVSKQNLADLSDAELASLAPPESQIFLVITVNDVHDKYKFITASYSITGTLMAIDRRKGAEIWKDAATGYASGSGILPAALSQVNKHKNAQSVFLRQALASFPKDK